MVASSGAHEEVEGLGMAQIPGVHDDDAVAEVVFDPVVGVTASGSNGINIHEVGDDAYQWASVAAPGRGVVEGRAGRRVSSRVSGQLGGHVCGHVV